MTFKRFFEIPKRTIDEFGRDRAPRLAAAISYYAIFSMPPLFILLIMLAGLIVDPEQIQGAIRGQIADLIGPQGADQVQIMIRSASRPGAGSPLRIALSVGAILVAASGAFITIQGALNTAWKVKPDPKRGTIFSFIIHRLFSLSMIGIVAVILLVSLFISAAVTSFGGFLADLVPAAVSGAVLVLVNEGFFLIVITVMFAAIFKILPDAWINWRDVWLGALITAVLFTIGKFLIAYYISRSNPGDVYGAAGSLAVILLWIYYSALILLLGAELIHVMVRQRGKKIRAKSYAVRIETEVHEIEKGTDQPEGTSRSPVSPDGQQRRRLRV